MEEVRGQIYQYQAITWKRSERSIPGNYMEEVRGQRDQYQAITWKRSERLIADK